MVIWKGYGILALVIVVLVGAAFSLFFELVIGVNRDWGACVGAFVSSAIIWFVGIKLNDPAKTKVFVEKSTGREYVVKPEHSLFFIKMQYWAFIVGVVAVAMLYQLFTSGRVS